MTWVWGLGPELLPVKRRLPAGRWGPVFRLTDPGKRVEVGLSTAAGTITVRSYLDEVEEDEQTRFAM